MCSGAAPGGAHAGIRLKGTAEGGGANFRGGRQYRRGRRCYIRAPLQAVKIIDSKFSGFRGASRAQIHKFRKFQKSWSPEPDGCIWHG